MTDRAPSPIADAPAQVQSAVNALTHEPWASIKGGRWHRTTTLAENFTDKLRSLCGLSFQPLNVSDGFPPYCRRDLWACVRCEAIHARTRAVAA